MVFVVSPVRLPPNPPVPQRSLLLIIKPTRPRPLPLRNRVRQRDLGDGLLAQVPPDGGHCEDHDGADAAHDDAVEVGGLVVRGPLQVAQGLAVEARGGRDAGHGLRNVGWLGRQRSIAVLLGGVWVYARGCGVGEGGVQFGLDAAGC